MLVTVEKIEESYALATGEMESYLILVLPNGERVRTTVDGDTARAVIAANQAASPAAAPPAASNGHMALVEWDPPAFIPSEALPETEPPPAGDPTVLWETLPDSVLPAAAKSILRSANIPKELPQTDFLHLREQIVAKLNAQQVGKVQWDSGPRSTVSSVPRRTVPMDEKGNPLPPGGIVEVDPGEGIDDEDGVQSL